MHNLEQYIYILSYMHVPYGAFFLLVKNLNLNLYNTFNVRVTEALICIRISVMVLNATLTIFQLYRGG